MNSMTERILITGGQGFIGSYVAKRAKALGYVPVIFDRTLRTPESDFFLGDITDYAAVTEAVGSCDYVIHCAGVLGTSETIDNPSPAVSTNIVGGLNVFQAMRQHNRQGVYVTVGNYWMNNSYSITKTTAERFAWMFNAEHGTRIAVVRALNAWGPGQKAGPVRKIMPNFVIPALRGEPITIYGDGEQVMDMIHVSDVADVLIRAAVTGGQDYAWDPVRNADSPLKYEAGTGIETTVNDIAASVLAALGKEPIEGETVQHVPMRGGEPERSIVLGDPGTLMPLYGMVPHLITLDEGLPPTIEYYHRFVG